MIWTKGILPAFVCALEYLFGLFSLHLIEVEKAKAMNSIKSRYLYVGI